MPILLKIPWWVGFISFNTDLVIFKQSGHIFVKKNSNNVTTSCVVSEAYLSALSLDVGGLSGDGHLPNLQHQLMHLRHRQLPGQDRL